MRKLIKHKNKEVQRSIVTHNTQDKFFDKCNK